MVPRKQGLILTVSSASGLMYSGMVTHGIGKAAVRLFFLYNLRYYLKKY
jgi:short-subunit dehydrogenase